MIIIMAAFIFLNKERGKLSTAANCEVPQGLFIFIILFFEAQKKTKQLQIQRKGNEKKPIMKVVKAKPTHGCDKMIKL